MTDTTWSEVAAVPDGGDFAGFYERTHPALYRALVLVTRNRHEAEDVMQDAFLRVWQRWDRVAGMDRPDGYLYRSAMNVFRSRRRRALVAIRRAAGTDRPDDGLAAADERDSVVRALAPLPARQRAAIVLTELLDLTSEQAGEALGIKGSTVRVLAARAKVTLRKELEP